MENSPKTDSISLQNLTQQLYKWLETNKNGGDFIPVETDEKTLVYKEIDVAIHEKRIADFEKSGFFASDFIKLYNEIANEMNLALKKGTVWEKGSFSPFDNGANPWCNCQDVPSDDYYNYLTINDLKIRENIATFVWKWTESSAWNDFSYQVKAKKEKGIWKIASLQGFQELNEEIKKINIKKDRILEN